MKPQLFESGISPLESLPKLETVANQLQILLMPIAYQESHPGLLIDMADAAFKNEMAIEWIQKYAEPFRDYIESPVHQNESIDLNDPESLRDFLLRMKNESETLH